MNRYYIEIIAIVIIISLTSCIFSIRLSDYNYDAMEEPFNYDLDVINENLNYYEVKDTTNKHEQKNR